MIEIITPAAQVLTTLEEFYAYKGWGSTPPTGNDTYWQVQLDVATDQIMFACGRPLVAELVKETFRFHLRDGGVTLERWPIINTTPPVVTYGGSETQDASTYEVNIRSGIVRRLTFNQYTYWQPGMWQFQYTGGYAAGSIPSALKMAVWELTSNMDQMTKWQQALKAERIEGVRAVNYADPDKVAKAQQELPPQIARMIAPYANAPGLAAA